MISINEFLNVDLRVGRIVSAEDHEGARKPMYKLRVDLGNPGAIYSSVVAGTEEMKAIAASIRAGLRSKLIAFDNKEFVPHVTVARIKHRIDESYLKNALGSFEGMSFGRFISGSVVLFRSTLGNKGPVYEKLYEREA